MTHCETAAGRTYKAAARAIEVLAARSPEPGTTRITKHEGARSSFAARTEYPALRRRRSVPKRPFAYAESGGSGRGLAPEASTECDRGRQRGAGCPDGAVPRGRHQGRLPRLGGVVRRPSG